MIIRNSAKCKKCHDEIESKGRWSFVTCKCGAISIDGGRDYQRWVGEIDNIEDTSILRDE